MPYHFSTMLTDYIREAMRLAHYELTEKGRFFGTIPALKVYGRRRQHSKRAEKSSKALWKIG